MTHPLLAQPRRRWPIALPLIAVVLLFGAWTAGWYYVAGQAEAKVDQWREREARFGRVHTCGRQSVGGFPFRLQVRCINAAVELRNMQPPLTVRAKEVLVVAQVYDTSLLISELTGPVTVSEPTRLLLTGTWASGQVSVRGLPATLERASLVIGDFKLDQPGPQGPVNVMNAERLELHGRIASGTPSDNPVLDLSLQAEGALVPALGTFSDRPGDIEITGVLRGLKQLAPRPWPVVLQELQTNGGRFEFTKARVQQDQVIALGTGTLAMSPSGRPDGALRLTVAGVEKVVQNFGLDRAFAQIAGQKGGALGMDRSGQMQNALDRIMPGLGNVARGKAAEAGVQMGLALLGEQTQLEGKRAVAMTVRFADGHTTLGPIRLGQVPPLY